MKAPGRDSKAPTRKQVGGFQQGVVIVSVAVDSHDAAASRLCHASGTRGPPRPAARVPHTPGKNRNIIGAAVQTLFPVRLERQIPVFPKLTQRGVRPSPKTSAIFRLLWVGLKKKGA